MKDHFIESLIGEGWRYISQQQIPASEKRLLPISELQLAPATKQYINQFATEGIYLHQKEAIHQYKLGQNVCIATGTASGKSLPFYVSGIESLVANHHSKVLVIYPLKALGVEQEVRWQQALKLSGLSNKVGRIDGQVNTSLRKRILKECSIVIMTPDVIHAWLLSNLSDSVYVKFMSSLSLIIVDEVHTYSGVFGSHSAFLFRRIRHLLASLGQPPQFVCASATIANPDEHLSRLFGVEFILIESNLDTSPKHGVDIFMMTPPGFSDFLSETSRFLTQLADTNKRFIAFVDSRKQTERLATILSRGNPDEENTEEIAATYESDHLRRLNILPYRSGYEEHDRNIIQKRLAEGSLQGIISTSALELGLDIPGLDASVLLGVPNSATSLFQRIGRIGRHKRGQVYIIHAGSYYDEIVFRKPESLLMRPLVESTLYLDNIRIQYIHTLCLARIGGEHDQIIENAESTFSSNIDWPDGFLELCHAERIGEISPELQQMKAEAGDDPNHVFPLRDVESQFKVEFKQGPEQRSLGQLSFAQVLRETYPGAVYYYTTQAFRVYRVNAPSKTVMVRKEKRYTTNPNFSPTLVFPNLTTENVHQARMYHDLLAMECNLQIRESVIGYKERRGPNELNISYPMNSLETGIQYSLPRFTRNYFSSGVVLTHPLFNTDLKVLEQIARLIFEGFLMCVPLERQDIDFAIDRHRVSREPHFIEKDRFIAIFDKTYGSLHLSSKVMSQGMMNDIFQQALEISFVHEELDITPATQQILSALIDDMPKEGKIVALGTSQYDLEEDYAERVVVPGSVGMAIMNGNREFVISDVFYNPKQNGLCYRGRYTDQRDTDTTSIILPIRNVIEIPGVSKLGKYNYDSGEVEQI